MTQTKYTYAPIVPLIGGEPLGTMAALNGQLPEYVLSYAPFGGHDSHYTNYLRSEKNWKGDYVVIDAPEYENYKPEQVDVVMSTCPCAGLSSLSTTSSADSATNDWMYKTAEYVLEHVKPKVFWGENAPRLYSSTGKKVADRLHEIGRKFGYSLTLYYTESRLHGLCQKRPRTFYFFTQGEHAPLFKYHRREESHVEDVLRRDVAEDDPMDLLINTSDPYDNAWLAYALHIHSCKTVKELYEKLDQTTNLIVGADRRFGQTLNEVADWMDSQNNPKFTRIAQRARDMQLKLDDNKGYWAHGITLSKGIIPSLIGAMPHSLINPFTEKFLTLRDCLRLMGMPDDFNLSGENPVSKSNMICQNVPVTTAADMMHGVIEYLDGSCEYGNSSYIKQSNKSQQWESVLPTNNTHDLDSFFHLQK